MNSHWKKSISKRGVIIAEKYLTNPHRAYAGLTGLLTLTRSIIGGLKQPWPKFNRGYLFFAVKKT